MSRQSPLAWGALLLLFGMASALPGCAKRGKANAWLSPGMGPLSVQDVNADGYDDCIVWMGQPTRTSLQVIDGKTGEHRYGFLSIDGESAVISGSHLIYATETSSRPFNTREQVTSPPQVALSDLRTGQLVASETLPRGTISLELFALGKDVIAHTPAGDLYVSVEQGTIAPSGAIYKTKAQLVGARGALRR